MGSRDNVLGMVTKPRVVRSEFRIPTGERAVSLVRNVLPGCEAHPPSYSVDMGRVSPRVKRPRRQADHSSPFRTEVKNEWRYTSTSTFLMCLRGM